MSEPTPKLPGRADQLLQGFPPNEPDFEAMSSAIAARIGAGVSRAPADEALLKAPVLAAEPGEPATPSQVRAAAPKSNFAEMARKSLQKKDDGAELAKELLAATAQSRRPNRELVERVRAAGRSPLTATGTPLPASSRDAVADPSAEEAPRASGVIARIEPPKPARLDRGTLIGIAGGIVALAACFALFLQSGRSEDPTSATLAAERASREAAPAPKAPPASELPVKQEEGVLSPEALAAAPEAAAPVGLGKVPAKSALVTPAPAAAKGAVTAPSVAPTPVELEEDPAPTAVAEKTDPLPPEPKLKPAEGSHGDVPLTPSAGAVGTALSSVRGGAQACLAGQSEAVTATVTFASDGHVLRVNASGPAASCIQAALSQARIAPFARESFTASTTIRPP